MVKIAIPLGARIAIDAGVGADVKWVQNEDGLSAGAALVKGVLSIPSVADVNLGRYAAKRPDGTVLCDLELGSTDGPQAVPPRVGPFPSLVVAAIALIVVVVVGVLGPVAGGGVTVAAYVMAFATVALATALISALVKTQRSDQGFFSLFIGADRRASSSKTQVLLWTLLIALSLSYVAAHAQLSDGSFICESDASANCILESTWETYLILLGLPAAAAVLAKGITIAKVNDGELQKSAADAPSVADVATDDAGNADLADVQYLVFNLIALLYVAANVIDRGVLPEVPAVLLALTGAAAATYTLNKGFDSNKPAITAVLPGVIAPNLHVRVFGQNLFPLGSSEQRATVKVGGKQVTGSQMKDDAGVEFSAPTGLSPAEPSLSIVTGIGIESPPFPVTIVSAPEVIGWAEAPGVPGGIGRLVVSGLPAVSAVDVAFESIVVRGAVDAALGHVGVSVPQALPPSGTVHIAVGAVGVWSQPKEVRLG